MGSNEDVEVQNELSYDETTTSSSTTISPDDFQTFNLNVATGFLGVVGSLGVIAGCIVAIIFKDIFKKC